MSNIHTPQAPSCSAPAAYLLALGLFGTVACTTQPDPASDRRAYLAGDCAVIGELRLRQECVLFRVRAEPRLDAELCPRLDEDFLREECWFVAVDARGLVEEEAREGCQKAGRYEGPCLANALSRELTIAEGKEAEFPRLERRFREILVRYQQPEAERRARELSLRILRRHIREHGDCDAPPDWCAAATSP